MCEAAPFGLVRELWSIRYKMVFPGGALRTPSLTDYSEIPKHPESPQRGSLQ